jgi:hypothetical protein
VIGVQVQSAESDRAFIKFRWRKIESSPSGSLTTSALLLLSNNRTASPASLFTHEGSLNIRLKFLNAIRFPSAALHCSPLKSANATCNHFSIFAVKALTSRQKRTIFCTLRYMYGSVYFFEIAERPSCAT